MDDTVPVVPSILHVTASSNINIDEDLNAEENHTIAELLDEQEKTE